MEPKKIDYRIRFRLYYSQETDQWATDNIPAYCDWLEKLLGELYEECSEKIDDKHWEKRNEKETKEIPESRKERSDGEIKS